MMRSRELETLLRDHADRLDDSTVPVTFDEVRETSAFGLRSEEPAVRRAVSRPRRAGWAYGLAAALIMLVVIGGGGILMDLLGGGGPPVVSDESTTPTPTTMPPSSTLTPSTIAPAPASIIGPPVTQLPLTFTGSEVPPFEGLVRQTAFWDSGAEAQVRIEVSYGGPPGSFRAEMVEAPDLPSRPALTAALFGLDYQGSFRVVNAEDGTHRFYGAEGVLESRPETYDPLKSLAWNHVGSASWEKVCQRTDQEVTAQGQVLGRFAHVVVCDGISDVWTLWVDAETGLVLKLDHETTASRIPTLGDFEFETITYDPVFSPDALDVIPPPGAEFYDEDPPPGAISPDPDVTYEVPEVPIATWQPWGSDVAGLKVGVPFPTFTAALLGGGTFDLAAERDKPLLMLTWYATAAYIDAGPGAVEIDALNLTQAYYELYQDEIDFLAVVKPYSRASPEVVDLIRESHGYTMPIAVDPSPFTLRQVMWVLVDTDGNVMAAECGCHSIRTVVPQLIAEALDAAG